MLFEFLNILINIFIKTIPLLKNGIYKAKIRI